MQKSICGRAQRAEEAMPATFVARGRMRTDRSVDDINIHTYIQTNRIGIEFTSTGSLR